MSDSLAIYLQDHLAGAKAAIDLLDAMRVKKDKPLSNFAAHLLTEVQADKDTLQRLADKVGTGSNVIKEFSGWLGEKATRIKLRHGSDDPFGEFEALEFLALGVRGKLSLWQALDVAAADQPRLSGYDYKQLAARAEIQYQEVEQQRIQLAKVALAPAQ
jgi:hypothetical protein